ncbi:maltokinase N-terminal cap-like domain-containing protein [Streptomyces albipurpureus]|uniref:Maltokinase n=1 Tax=Streptomyces albipurpureus TaxID=2897419 RepID=A0ABT0UHP1_9ACTN|nr:maltokinase [Streptomyces sp. CWNU-1]MCM2387826.1 maltokinase [Streptomyces sp. CWNU-1]
MAEAASTRTSVALLPSLAPLLLDWLPHQRWFAGKGHPITGLSLVSATELLPSRGPGPGLLHLLVEVRQPGLPTDGPRDCYQLMLGVREALPRHLAPALIGRPTDGPLAGRMVYEGLHDPRLAELILERLRSPGALGPLRFSRFDRSPALPGGLTAKPLEAEQSNSSLVYGDTYILKVFRRVQTGPNPDLELPLALARAGCGRVPVPVAWYESTAPQPYTLGVLQPYLRGSQDGWRLALDALAAGRSFTDEARALGRVTAEVHTALAAALPTVLLRQEHTEQLTRAMRRRLEEAARAVPALLPYVPRLGTAFDAVAALGRRGRVWRAQRVHGDLHLGQALHQPPEPLPPSPPSAHSAPTAPSAPAASTAQRARSDLSTTAHPGLPAYPALPPAPPGHWSVIDFEGEPARPLHERRSPQPPVRDIAGMLRSFDYAARSHSPWNPAWAERCRAAYCEGYAQSSGDDPRAEPELLRAYETDKAVYEAVYEARHRPSWLPVPMAAIERLAALA